MNFLLLGRFETELELGIIYLASRTDLANRLIEPVADQTAIKAGLAVLSDVGLGWIFRIVVLVLRTGVGNTRASV